MQLKAISLLFIVSVVVHAEPLKTVFNPFTGRQDYITRIDSNTIQAGTNITVTNNSNGTVTVNSSGGGGQPYTPPTIALGTSPSGKAVELGTSLSNIALSAITVENSSPIVSVAFFRNGTVIFNVPSPPSGGGTSTYTDTATITNTATYTAKVSDGGTTVTSNSVAFTFVYPFYYGVGAQGLTGAQVQALTDLVQVKQNTTVTTSPTNQVYYFAYPQAYGSLTSIKDQNGFNTTAGYTQRTATLTMMDSTNQAYYIYEFNTLTTQTNFSNTYNF